MNKTTFIYIAFIFSIGLVVAQDGRYDTSFGDNGMVYTDINEQEDNVTGFDQSLLGRIGVIGLSYDFDSPSNDYRFIIVYLENGEIDTSFANDGYLLEQIDNSWERFRKIAFQSDEKIILSSILDDEYRISKLLANGSIDTDFANNGYLVPYQSTGITRFILDENDRILTFSSQNNTVSIKRFLANGSIDDSFGTNGSLEYTLQTNMNATNISSKFLDDGKLLITYKASNSEVTQQYIAKFLPDGNSDLSFGTNGKIFIPVAEDFNCGTSVFNDGKLLVSCSYWDSDIESYIRQILKYTSQGSLDTSFGENGYINGYNATLIQENQRFIAQNHGSDFEGGIHLSYHRFYNNGSVDDSFQFFPGYQVLGSAGATITNSGKFLIVGNTIWYDGPVDIALLQFNNSPLGIIENNKTPTIVFPNPSNGLFNLKTQKSFSSKYQITDSNGRVLRSGSFQGSENQLDLSSFASGVYFLKISGTTVKLLKQ